MDLVRQRAWQYFAALALPVALAAEWCLERWIVQPHTAARFAVLGSGALASVSGVAALFAAALRRERAVRSYLGLVDRMIDGQSSDVEIPARLLATLGNDSPWIAAFERIRLELTRRQQRAEELEQARAATDVRARRNEARCEQMAAVVDTMPEPVVAINGFDEVVLMNPSARQALGIENGAEQQALAQLVRCEKLVSLLVDTRRRRIAAQRTCELELADENGRPRWFSATARNLMSDATAPRGSPEGAVAVLHEIGVLKAAQQRNAEFVSAVSHEMKTPLSGIKAYVELLADGDAEDEKAREEFLEVINSQADRLQRLVDNLLNLARIEAGVVAVNKQSQSLNELLENGVRVVQPSADAKQIRLTADLSPMYLGVRVDLDLILQAAINLLSNAIKYTPAGGQVTMRSRLTDDQVRFEVEDTGIGLSPDDCQKVFEKFYRVPGSKGMAPGTGLGLPLAKHIVEDVHGGKLWVESTLGQGSKFIVTLPGAAQID